MDIAAFIRSVAEHYDRQQGLRTRTQDLLRHADRHLQAHVPGGIKIAGSGGKGTATLTPWVGFFDPDETTSPEEGLYLVYLFSEGLDHVHLMLLQGITRLDRELGHKEARRHLAEEAASIRTALSPTSLDGLDVAIDLGSSGYRQLAYSSACVVARSYETGGLPSEQQLRTDLWRLLALYQDAVLAKRQLAVDEATTSTEATASLGLASRIDPLAYFRPKDDSDYVASLVGRQLVKSRRHERLVREYGEWAREQGFAPSTTEHPKDLVLRRGGKEWLVEAKVLYRGNATNAVRGAVGQLLQYQHFLCDQAEPPQMVALFTEPVGDAYIWFLESLGIACVWKEMGSWRGSRTACEARLGKDSSPANVS